MKRCPECRRDYYDDTLLYCLDDGNALLEGPASGSGAVDEPATAILHLTAAPGEAPTRAQIHMTDQTAILPANTGDIVPTSRGLDKRLLVVPLLLAILALGGFFGYRYFKPAGAEQITSIAVLPFQNRSEDADTDYLSDGLAESLIFRLSQLPGLKVSPASSVIRYKGKETDTAKIASELGVDAVMTGRLVKRGDNLNITVELVDVRNNTSLWGEQYERKMSEILATQREIATEITQKLKLKLSGSDEQKLAKKYTDNDEAYQLYLRGRFHLAKRSKEDLIKAIDYYQQAIKLDPNYALAYVGISFAYQTGTYSSFFSRADGTAKTKEAATKALEIDPSLAEAHATMAMSQRLELNLAEAEREIKRAMELDPNNSYVHYLFGLILEDLGRTGDAVREIKTAVEMEPMSLIMNANLAGAYMFDGQYERALVEAKRAYDLDPNFFAVRSWLMYVYCANKMYPQAIDIYEASAKDETIQLSMAYLAANAYAKAGRRSEAELLLKREETNEDLRQTKVATIYTALGDKEKAFAALEKGLSAKDPSMSRFRVDPLLEDLRGDPRFADLIKRMNFPQ